MSEMTYKQLKGVRESADFTRWRLAQELGYGSESMIKRWENGEQKPTPDDIGNLERVLGEPGLWYRWMCSNYDSFRERYADQVHYDHLLSVVTQVKRETLDVIRMHDGIEADALDGAVHKPEFWRKYRQECKEAMAAMQLMLDKTAEIG